MEKAKLINLKDLAGNPAEYLPHIGGKAAGLAVIQAQALPCPPTWVVPTGLFAAFRKLAEVATAEARAFNGEALLKQAADFVAAQIGDELNGLPRLNYAARSSATVEDAAAQSFAGMFESILNAAPDELPLAVARVWLSGLGERVRAYSGDPADRRGDLAGRQTDPVAWPDMAVVLQPMVDAVYAGVCFSRHPSPQDVRDTGQVLVEIVPGAGEQLVRGEVTPLSFVGSYANLSACLDRPWMRELAAAVARLERYTGGPVDVEFAVDKQDRLWILQQRPVTVIDECDTLLLTGYRKAYKRTLCSLDIEFLIAGCARYLAPYLELPPDLARWMVMTTNPSDGQQELWVHEQLDDTVIKLISEHILSDNTYMARLAHRYDRHHRQSLDWQASAWADEGLPLIDRLQDFFEFAVPLNAHYYAPMHIIEALSLLMLESMKRIDQESAEDDFFKLTTYGVTTLGQVFADRRRELKEQMSRGVKTLPDNYRGLSLRWQKAVDELAAGFGFLNCHLPYEPPYDSKEVYGFIKEDACKEDGCREDAREKPAREKILAQDQISVLETKYAALPEWSGHLALLREWLNRRNRQMEYLYFVYAQARPLLKAVGETAGLSIEEVWQVSRGDLLQAMTAAPGGADPALPGTGQTGPGRDRAGQNRAKYDHGKLCLYHDGHKVCFRDDVRPVYAAPVQDGAQVLRGRTVFGSGEISGTVRIAFSPEEVNSPGLIVVTGMTTPDFVPALTKKAAALITDEGGILCHAAIIAREIRLPCIVGAGVATEKLVNGARVILDLDRGEIRSV